MPSVIWRGSGGGGVEALDLRKYCALSGIVFHVCVRHAKDLIQRQLVLDAQRRLSASEALRHPWIETLAGASSGNPLGPHVLENLRNLVAEMGNAKKLKKQADEAHAIEAAGSGIPKQRAPLRPCIAPDKGMP